jgi:hypothetical protein
MRPARVADRTEPGASWERTLPGRRVEPTVAASLHLAAAARRLRVTLPPTKGDGEAWRVSALARLPVEVLVAGCLRVVEWRVLDGGVVVARYEVGPGHSAEVGWWMTAA